MLKNVGWLCLYSNEDHNDGNSQFFRRERYAAYLFEETWWTYWFRRSIRIRVAKGKNDSREKKWTLDANENIGKWFNFIGYLYFNMSIWFIYNICKTPVWIATCIMNIHFFCRIFI